MSHRTRAVEQVSAYLVQFAATNNPNNGPFPSWPQFDLTGDVHLALDVPIGSFVGYRTTNCDFWDAQP